MKAPEALLFDLDGTLVNTYRLYLEAYRRAVAPVLGREPTLEEIAARTPSAERRFLMEWVGEEHADRCHDDLCRHYAELLGALGRGPYEGVREMLTALTSAGYPLGIVTGKGRRIWELTEPWVGGHHFEVVITEDDVAHPKPHPEGLILAAERLAIPPAKVAYIGDSLSDLAAGREAGMAVGAALWPKTDAEDRESFLAAVPRYAPDWLFESPADVTRRFASWC
ncbi:MAG TPA: HAD family hydrolase [Longimicrobiaceae bacterium]